MKGVRSVFKSRRTVECSFAHEYECARNKIIHTHECGYCNRYVRAFDMLLTRRAVLLVLLLSTVLPVIIQSREYTMRRSAKHVSARRRDGFVLFERWSASSSSGSSLNTIAGVGTDKTIPLSAALAFRTYLPNTRVAKLRFLLTNGQQAELFLLLRNCRFTALWSSHSASLAPGNNWSHLFNSL